MRAKKMHPLIDEEKQKLARRYKKDALIVSIFSYIVSALFLIALLYFNISKNFVEAASDVVHFRPLLIFIFFASLYIVYSVISFPFPYVDGYVIEHKYGFSTQSFKAWLTDWTKSFFVSLVLGAIVFEFIYLITPVSLYLWWLWLSLVMILFSVVLANLFPVLILPLFYRTSPIENESLRSKVAALCVKAKINAKGIYSINLSSKSTKANAAVTGLGNTKRVLLGDTFISNYTEDEIMPVLAHEISHYREHHIWWSILWQSLIILGMFYVLYRIHPYFYRLAGFERISDIAAFPVLALIFAVISFLLKPLSSAISRHYERRADRGALELTNNPDGFISVMAKFCNKQLMIAYPHPLIEWYRYSHPSPGNRIAFAEGWKAAHDS